MDTRAFRNWKHASEVGTAQRGALVAPPYAKFAALGDR
jgi:hypothetical protein